MALAAALVSSPGGAVAAGRKGLVGFFGVVRTNPAAAVSVVPAATFVVPRNIHPGHWPGAMQILSEPRTDRYREATRAYLDAVVNFRSFIALMETRVITT